MAEPNNPVSTLLPYMTAGNCIGAGSRGTVWLIRQAETDRMVAIKRISIPTNQQNVQALLFSGAVSDEQGAQEYYNRMAGELTQELEALDALGDCPNVLPFQGSFLTPKEDGIGYDLYLLSEYHETLRTYMAYNAMTQLQALNLALDVCTALEAYRAAGLVHRDVRPENIYFSPRGQYMLGDLGAVKMDQLDYAFIPEEQFNAYSAPETADGASGLNPTIDLYSLGLVLYRIYNGGHAPLEDEETNSKTAEGRRVAGEALPAPMYADYELSEIICKACAPKPEDRYQDPSDLKQDLTLYMQRNRVSDDLIVPPLVTHADAPVESAEPEKKQPLVTPPAKPEPETPAQQQARTQKANKEAVDTIIAQTKAEEKASASGSKGKNAPAETKPAKAAPETNNVEPAPAKKEPAKAALAKKADENKSRKILVPVLIAMAAIVVLMAAFIAAKTHQKQGSPAADPAVEETPQAETAPGEEAAQPLEIRSMDARVVSTEKITVTLEADEVPDDLVIVCADSYGNTFQQDYDPAGNSFTGLDKGVDYLFTLQSAQPLSGVTKVNAVTDNTPTIEGLTPSTLTDTEIQLDFDVSGVMPKEWKLELSDAGGLIQSATFAGSAVLLKGLNPGTEYTIALSAADGSRVLGETSYTFTTEKAVTLKSFAQTAAGKESLTLTWLASGSLPESWDITCTDAAGATETRTAASDSAAETSFTWDGLTGGESYQFTLACEGLKDSELNGLTLTVPILEVTDISAAPNDDGTATVAWTCSSPLAPAAWNVISSVELAGVVNEQTVTASGNTAVITGLLPGTTYTVRLEAENGETPEGQTTCSFTAPAAGPYTGNGVNSVYMVMWLPGNTPGSLAQPRAAFSPAEKIAFAVQANANYTTDPVTVLYVLRDAAGTVVSLQDVGSVAWNELWNSGVFIGSLDNTPQAAGQYTLEIYFDGKLLSSAGFGIQ